MHFQFYNIKKLSIPEEVAHDIKNKDYFINLTF